MSSMEGAVLELFLINQEELAGDTLTESSLDNNSHEFSRRSWEKWAKNITAAKDFWEEFLACTAKISLVRSHERQIQRPKVPCRDGWSSWSVSSEHEMVCSEMQQVEHVRHKTSIAANWLLLTELQCRKEIHSGRRQKNRSPLSTTETLLMYSRLHIRKTKLWKRWQLLEIWSATKMHRRKYGKCEPPAQGEVTWY